MTTALPRRFTRGKILGYYSSKYFFYSLVMYHGSVYFESLRLGSEQSS